jgi:hypothetical protein
VLFFCSWAPCHEGILGEWRYRSTHYLILALDGGELSASRPGRFTPRERAPGVHWIGGWVGPRAPTGNLTIEPWSSRFLVIVSQKIQTLHSYSDYPTKYIDTVFKLKLLW